MAEDQENPYLGWKPADIREYEFLKGKRAASGNQVQLSPQGGPLPLKARARWELQQRQRDSTYTRADAERLHELERNHGLKETTAGENPGRDFIQAYDRSQRMWAAITSDLKRTRERNLSSYFGGSDGANAYLALQNWYRENKGMWGDILASYDITEDQWSKLDAKQRLAMGREMLGLEQQGDGSYSVTGPDPEQKRYADSRASAGALQYDIGLGGAGDTAASKILAHLRSEIDKDFKTLPPEKATADAREEAAVKLVQDWENKLPEIEGVSREDLEAWTKSFWDFLSARQTMRDADEKRKKLPFVWSESAWKPSKPK